METRLEAQLSFELQELYLENKEWLSNILFLEDEMRFFQQTFQKLLESPIKQSNSEQVEFINSSLIALQERRNHLKGVLNNRKEVLEAMFNNEAKAITIAFIEEDNAIVNEIKALLATDQNVKKELFALIEILHSKIKTQLYPIL